MPRDHERYDASPDRPEAPTRLLSEFEPVDLESWHAEVVRSLKGASFEETMLTPTYEGLTLHPIYTARDLPEATHVGAWPGEFPFVRGGRTLGYREASWDVVQELRYPTVEEFNAALRRDIERGQNAVALILDAAGRQGRDPDQAAVGVVGRDGVSVASVVGLGRALDGVDLQAYPLFLDAGAASLPAAALIVALMRRRGEDPARLRGCVGYDPLALLATEGALPAPSDRLARELAGLTSWASENAPGLRTLVASGRPYHEAGASAVQEVAFTIAAAVAQLRTGEEHGLPVAQAVAHLQIELGVGTGFFLQIAKLRAARMLWAQVVRACGLDDEAAATLHLHARTSRRALTSFDKHVNLLRGTTEAMAAVLGGADSLNVAPFDEALGLPSPLARRLALNTHTILREESHLDAVVDPAGGSWYVEYLTAEVAEKAWSVFREIEAAGGLSKALQEGEIQGRIAAVADERFRDVAARQAAVVGVNRYPNGNEGLPEEHRPDYAAVHAQRAADLQRLRTSGETDDDVQALAGLDEILSVATDRIAAAVIAAAEHGATIGELTRALRAGAVTGPAVGALVAQRAAAPFENLRAAVLRHREKDPASVRVFLGNLGDVAGFGPRLDFARAFFEIGGFVTAEAGFFATPEEAAAAAREDGAATVVLVGRDETYAEQAAAVARLLKQKGGPRTVVLAGYPKPQVVELKKAGVDLFVHLRSDALAVLSGLARENGVAVDVSVPQGGTS